MVFFGIFHRIYRGMINPPVAKKKDDAIRFGLLGASNIAPFAVIGPAKSHEDVIIAAVAARDRKRAETYAQKYQIPIVHSSYQDLLDDPSIDAIYIALPNGLHFEWALRAIKAGKHVLLEKPSTSNGAEAEMLFNHPLTKAPGAPILLEAFHYRFHPAWQTFLSLLHVDPVAGPVKHAYAQQFIPKGTFPRHDIRYNYDLAGGCMMDFGTYSMNMLRQILQEEPQEVVDLECRCASPPKPEEIEGKQIDLQMKATFQTASGKLGTLLADMEKTGGYPLIPAFLSNRLPSFGWPKAEAMLEEKVVSNSEGDIYSVKRDVTLWNPIMPVIYHRIDVHDTHTIQRDGQIVKTWKETRYLKAYTWPSNDERLNIGQEWWTTYHHQLNEFVNKIKGRKGSGVWIDGDDSIKQMEAIDRIYKHAGLELRPTSDFQL